MPGVPVLQNAWATPGIVAAANFGGGSDGSVYALAGGWTPGSGRFQFSGGVGTRSISGAGSKTVYGLRAAMPFGSSSGTFGFAAFAGVGGGQAVTRTAAGTVKTGPADTLAGDSTSSTTQIPLGAAIGWRRAIGSNHGLSVYATPAYVLFSGGTSTGGVFRVAVGADFGITSAIGATAGVEFGGSRPKGAGGPTGTTYGLGISYAFGRR
jgi:hypothetical protein